MNGILLSFALALLSTQQMAPGTPAEDVETASKFAVKAATIAGGARNCKFDKAMVEEYISLAQTRISGLAKDKEENVLAKMDFTNSLVVAAIKPPKEGCEAFHLKFLTALHDLN